MPAVRVTIGPVPAGSARAWVATARQTLAAIRAQDDLIIPAEVLDGFERYVDEWAELAEAIEPFVWSGDVDTAEVRRLSAHWLVLATVARTDATPVSGVEVAPPDAQPFYDALVTAMATAAAADDTEHFAEKFREAVPDFTESIPGAVPPEGAIRVLLVDDRDDIRVLYRVAFESDPRFEVCGEAPNGRDALALAANECPDAVVLDVEMPVMDGLTALPQLLERCPGTRVVIVSAADERREEALALGAAAFLPKVASLDELREALAGE